MNTICNINSALESYGENVKKLNDSLADLLEVTSTSNLSFMNEKIGDSSLPDMLDTLIGDLIVQTHQLDVIYTKAAFRATQLLNLREPNIIGFSSEEKK